MTDTSTRTDDRTLQAVFDRQNVTETIIRVANYADDRAWESLRACFAGEVHVDYTSLTGGTPTCIAADVLITNWRGLLPGFDATHHALTNPLVTLAGNEASAEAYVTADHYLAGAEGGDRWTVQGRYRYELARKDAGWVVTSLTLTLTHQHGNLNLPSLAAQRVQRS